MTKKLLIVPLTIFLFSCRDIHTPTDNKASVPEWDLFKIKVDQRQFWIPFNEDSSILVTQLPDSVTKYFRSNQKTYISKTILIPKAEKDSILKLAIEAITKPVLTVKDVSDYAGHYLTLTLEYAGATKLECKYSSVYSWTSISPTIKKISERTFEKYGR
jgi:hypothetical protein